MKRDGVVDDDRCSRGRPLPASLSHFAVVDGPSEVDKWTMYLDRQTLVWGRPTGLEIGDDRGDLTGSLVTGTGWIEPKNRVRRRPQATMKHGRRELQNSGVWRKLETGTRGNLITHHVGEDPPCSLSPTSDTYQRVLESGIKLSRDCSSS